MKVIVKDDDVDLSRVIRNASAGDEIVLERGDYIVGDAIVNANLSITGKGGGLTRLIIEGDGIICDGVMSLKIEGLSFISSSEGGIFNVRYGRVEMVNCEFAECRSSSFEIEVGVAVLDGCSFCRNEYGLLSREGSVVSVRNCKFSDNQAAAIWIEGGDVKIENSFFENNGLGVAATWNSRVKLTGNTFVNHRFDPAVVVMERASAVLLGNSFSNCRCGVLVSRYSTVTIEENTFTSCGDARTPAISISSNCSIKGNILESNKFSELRGAPLEVFK
ncbi:MAG: right-handed parallel beta-helix repeat-containing protein [Candidatus Jordarchaeales archaeon]